MRAHVASYELIAAASLPEALALLDAQPGVYKPLAGGTDLMVVYAGGKLAHTRFVDLSRLGELRGITETSDAITFGALTTYTDVQRHATVVRELPMLVLAASETGGWAIQNRGTIGGNIVNASPAADTPPALLAYDAEVELSSARGGARWVPYSTFHTGYKATILKPEELITRVRVPRAAGPRARVSYYRKVGPRKAQAISKVCFAGCAEIEAGKVTAARIALGGVAPVVLRCVATERALVGGFPNADAAIATLAREITPIDDVRSNARYRRQVAENLLRELVRTIGSHVGLDPNRR